MSVGEDCFERFPPACSVFLDGCGRSRRRRLHSVVAWERVDKSNLEASVHLELCGVDRGLVRFLGRHAAPLASGKRSCPHVVPCAGKYKARRREPAGLVGWAGGGLPSTYRGINSRLRSRRRILAPSPLRLLGITGERECCAPAYSREASCPNLDACRPSFHPFQLSAPPVRSARPR